MCSNIYNLFVLLSFIFLSPHLIRFSHANHHAVSEHVCAKVHDPKSCALHISEVLADNQIYNGFDMLKSFFTKSIPQMQMALEAATNTSLKFRNNNRETGATADCMKLMDMSIDRTDSTLAAIANWRSQSDYDDAHTWLSGILTNHVTCLDGLASHNDTVELSPMKELVQELISRTRTSLAVLVSVSAPDHKDVIQQPLSGGFPSWISAKDRKLLGSSLNKLRVNAVVGAENGCGDYGTIQAAVDAAPDNSNSRYVIYVKRGIYEEHVVVWKKKKNIMIIGDGMHSTVITGSLNVVDGTSTFDCATLTVEGDGFILQDMWVQNTAGPEKHQAVAIRVSADKSVIHRCQLDGYEDTLYAHRDRQFYRDCLIWGTVDFIFGDAAVVLQNCQIVAKKPMDFQQNEVTAQGRIDPNQNSGTSIQFCDILPSDDLVPVQNKIPSYLGRPWKEYSRVVVMQSYIESHIDPAGWDRWNHQDFALDTLYYGEYSNTGPGSDTSLRVTWPGYHVITDSLEANKFTVAELIHGNAWLGSTSVPYTEGL